MAPSNPLAQANTAWVARLQQALAEAGVLPHPLSEWTFRLERNQVRLLVGLAVDARASAEQPNCRDLTRFLVQLRVHRLFDIGGTPLALDLEPLAQTLKGGKSEALVSEQLAHEVLAAPVEPYAAALLAAMA